MIDILRLINQDRPRVGNTLILSIDGHGGSGKSTLAKALSACISCEVIHTDDFASMDNPRDWWRNLVCSVLKPIESGATVLNYERSKWWPEHHPEPVVNQNVTNVMIIEGVGSSQLPLRKFIGLSVFVDTPKDICLQRGIARDRQAGVGSEEEIAMHWNAWIQEELDYFATENPKQFAQHIVNGETPFNQQVKGLS